MVAIARCAGHFHPSGIFCKHFFKFSNLSEPATRLATNVLLWVLKK